MPPQAKVYMQMPFPSDMLQKQTLTVTQENGYAWTGLVSGCMQPLYNIQLCKIHFHDAAQDPKSSLQGKFMQI